MAARCGEYPDNASYRLERYQLSNYRLDRFDLVLTEECGSFVWIFFK